MNAQGNTLVLDETERLAGQFLAFPNAHYLTAVVLWIAHTWAPSAFYVTPRLVIDSAEPGSGKTRLLEVLAILCRAPRLTLSTTTAALYRRIANSEQPPTILQDEADALFGRANKPEHEELRALYNSGYKRGATVDRCETVGKQIVVREFPVFAPVALAGLAGKMPATITDRSVVLHMRRRAPEERVAEFRDRDARLRAAPVRDRLEAWAAENLAALEECRPVMPDGVRDRPAEVWEALLAVADVAGGEWPGRARAACEHFVLQADPDALSFGVRLLRDVRTAFGERDRMFSSDLVAALVGDDEAEWSNLWGKPLDQNRLAKEMKRYGIKSDRIRIGQGQARGYVVDGDTGLLQAWHRYLPHSTDSRPSRPSRPDAGQSDSEASPRRPEASQDTDRRPSRPEGVPDEIPPKQQLFSNGTDGTLGTPMGGNQGASSPRHLAAVPVTRPPRPKFKPPNGPDRCPQCGWHTESQGHADDCTANDRPRS